VFWIAKRGAKRNPVSAREEIALVYKTTGRAHRSFIPALSVMGILRQQPACSQGLEEIAPPSS
jgi:hypothetical protein